MRRFRFVESNFLLYFFLFFFRWGEIGKEINATAQGTIGCAWNTQEKPGGEEKQLPTESCRFVSSGAQKGHGVRQITLGRREEGGAKPFDSPTGWPQGLHGGQGPRRNPVLWGQETVSPNLLLTPLVSSRLLIETELENCKKKKKKKNCAGATNRENVPAPAAASTKTARTHADTPTSALHRQTRRVSRPPQ